MKNQYIFIKTKHSAFDIEPIEKGTIMIKEERKSMFIDPYWNGYKPNGDISFRTNNAKYFQSLIDDGYIEPVKEEPNEP